MVKGNLCSFHALTGCDSTSQFAGKSKKTVWKIFLRNPYLLGGMSKGELSSDDFKDVKNMLVHRG